MKKVLIVAYHFPPAGGRGAAGSLRISKFVRYLPEQGWQPTVLSVRESDYEDNITIDTSLTRDVPADLPQVRTRVLHPILPLFRLKGRLVAAVRGGGGKSGVGASNSGLRRDPDAPASRYQRFKDAITDLLKVPDEAAGWFLPAFFAGRRAIRRERLDAVLATGRPWTSLVVGAALKAVTKRPLVVDFRDPWTTNPFRAKPSWLKDVIEKRLERWVVRSADVVIANTEQLREEFVGRYGEGLDQRCITVLNGFDSAEFESLLAVAPRASDNRSFVMLHAGVLYGKRDPRTFIEALEQLNKQGAFDGIDVRCELLGDIKLHYDLAALVASSGLQDIVHMPGEVSYKESIQALGQCDAALLLQPGTATQVPSKLYEYIGMKRRIVAVAPSDSAVSRLIDAYGLGGVADAADPQGIAAVVSAALDEWRAGRLPAYASDPELMARFDIRQGVRRLAGRMDTVAD